MRVNEVKVLMIGSNLKVPGGITRVVKNYYDAGLNLKVKLEYFPTYLGRGNIANIAYFTLKYILLFFNLFILRKSYDVVHIHMSYKGSFVRKKHIIKLLNIKNIPIILHMHGSQFKDFYNNGTQKRKAEICNILNRVDVIIALGLQWKEFYKSISSTKVISIDNAVFPKKIEAKNEKVYLTSMGVLSERKGTYDLIKVVDKLRDKIDSKYKFLLAGNGDIEKVKSIIKDLNLEDYFIIPGWINDEQKIEEIYKKSVLYLLPSYNEGMPMSILEAMSYGLPIISTNVGSISSVVEEENGILVNPGEINEISEAILQLLNNPEKVKKIRKINSSKIDHDYNIYNSVELLSSLYTKVYRKEL